MKSQSPGCGGPQTVPAAETGLDPADSTDLQHALSDAAFQTVADKYVRVTKLTNREPSPAERPHVGVHMRCCNVYVHAYANHDRSAFVAWCPRCAAQVRIPIVQEGGSSSRIFGAS